MSNRDHECERAIEDFINDLEVFLKLTYVKFTGSEDEDDYLNMSEDEQSDFSCEIGNAIAIIVGLQCMLSTPHLTCMFVHRVMKPFLEEADKKGLL